MLGPPKLRCLDQPILASLEELVPANHFYRHLEAALDLSFVRGWVQALYADRGRPSIDPVVFFKLQLILFFEGLRSERKLLETVALNLAHRWYLGYHLDEPLPDHSSLTRIRTRLGLPIFQRFFERVVELCRDAGLVWGEELIFDGTKVQANASIDALRSRWSAAARTYLDDLFAGDVVGPAPWALTPEDEPFPSRATAASTEPPPTVPADATPDAPTRLPFARSVATEAPLAAVNAAQWRLLDERRRDPNQPSSSRGYQRLSDGKVNPADPDATPMRRFNGDLPKLGYHDHYVVDGGRARIILAAIVTPADVMDNTPMLDLFHRVCFRWHLRPKRAVGDAKYGTIFNVRQLEELGVHAYLPMPEMGRRFGFYGPDDFTYDAARDRYRCPQGEPLTFERVKWTEDVRVYRADPSTCNACPAKSACTDSTRGRIVQRSVFSAFVERVKGYYATVAYQKAMRKRKVWIEPLFGEAKEWHGLRKFRLRRLWKVNCEGLLIAAGQNLKRWLSKTGWGRRHGPAGSLALASVTATTHPSLTIP